MSLNDLRDALAEQARAFFVADPRELEHANVRLQRTLVALRSQPAALDVNEQATVRQMLSTQSELLTRASSVNRVALRTLDLPVYAYPSAGSYPVSDFDPNARRQRTHVKA